MTDMENSSDEAVEAVARLLNPGEWWDCEGSEASKAMYREKAAVIVAKVEPLITARLHDLENNSEGRPVARSKSALRRLPVGSVVLSYHHRYHGFAWQKTAGERWAAQDGNWMPTDRMVALLGPLTVIYRGEARRG